MSGVRKKSPESVTSKSQAGSRSQSRVRGLIQAPDSLRLLSAGFCTSKMKVHPGILMKTKKGEVSGARYQVSV